MKFDEIDIQVEIIQQANVNLEQFNETLKRLRETKLSLHGMFVFGQDDGASPVRIIDSTATVIDDDAFTSSEPREQ